MKSSAIVKMTPEEKSVLGIKRVEHLEMVQR